MEIQAKWAIWEKRGKWREGLKRWATGWLSYAWGRARIYVMFASLQRGWV